MTLEEQYSKVRELAKEAKKSAKTTEERQAKRQKLEDVLILYVELEALDPENWEPLFYNKFYHVYNLCPIRRPVLFENIESLINVIPQVVKKVCELDIEEKEKSNILSHLQFDLHGLCPIVQGYIMGDDDLVDVGRICERLASMMYIYAEEVTNNFGTANVNWIQRFAWDQALYVLGTSEPYKQYMPNFQTIENKVLAAKKTYIPTTEVESKSTGTSEESNSGCLGMIMCIIGSTALLMSLIISFII